MSLDKPLADYTADECLAEITARVDLDTEVGKEIDMLAGQVTILCLNAQSRARRSAESADDYARALALTASWIRHLLKENKGRKTLPYEAVERIYRERLV